MARKFSHWAAAVAAGVTVVAGGLLVSGGPASAAEGPADFHAVAAVSHAVPSSAHSCGEGCESGRAVDEGRSRYTDGYSWYRLDYGLFYRWDGDRWVAQAAEDTGFMQSLNYRYDDGQFYHWDGTRWVPGTGRSDDITQGPGVSPDPRIVEQA